jgi:hypothetical protein
MTEAQERAEEIESQLSELLHLVNHEDFADLYDGDVGETKALLKERLTTLRTNMRQMSHIAKANFFPGNPIFDDANRLLIKEVESIGVELEFEVNRKFESIANQLAEKAKKAEVEGKGSFQKAFEALDQAFAIVEAPVAKAAALTTAIKTFMDFFQAIPK